LGDLERLTGLFESAGLQLSSTRARTGAIRALSIDQYVTTEIESTPLIERISDDVYQRIRADAGEALQSLYSETDGFQMPIVGHLLTASRRG
jgi:hypothetical protein